MIFCYKCEPLLCEHPVILNDFRRFRPETEKSIKIAIRIRFDSIRLGLLFEFHNSVRLDSIRLIHNRISYFLFSVVLIMCACKNGSLFLPRAHSFLVLEFISHRIIIGPMKISTTKKRINTNFSRNPIRVDKQMKPSGLLLFFYCS